MSALEKQKQRTDEKSRFYLETAPREASFFAGRAMPQVGNLEDIFLWRDGMAERGEARLAMRSALQQDAVWKGKP